MLVAKKNRQALFEQLLPNSIAILPGSIKKYRSKDVEYSFRQDSDFFYLTEFPEPDAIAIFIKEGNNNQFILFHQEEDLHYSTWHGARISSEQVIKDFGADRSYRITEINTILPELLLNKDAIYFPILKDPKDFKDTTGVIYENNLFNWYRSAFSKIKAAASYYVPIEIKDLSGIIHELRIIKSAAELTKIRYVTEVSANAHNYIMQYLVNNKNLTEKIIEAEFYNYCIKHGCHDLAYPPIVASGANACILHYNLNNAKLKNNDLLLLDAGGEYNYYAADITRVFPVNGKFSSRQKEIYNLVLNAQTQAIDKIKPGVPWSLIQQTIIEILVKGLLDLKILTGTIEEIIHNKKYQEFYMHGSGHFLGMDVHDVGLYHINNSSRVLSPGMVLTVEPGLYFSANSSVASEWQGLGVRIEDDILVTDLGNENLTKVAIKEISDIEYLMRN